MTWHELMMKHIFQTENLVVFLSSNRFSLDCTWNYIFDFEKGVRKRYELFLWEAGDLSLSFEGKVVSFCQTLLNCNINFQRNLTEMLVSVYFLRDNENIKAKMCTEPVSEHCTNLTIATSLTRAALLVQWLYQMLTHIFINYTYCRLIS